MTDSLKIQNQGLGTLKSKFGDKITNRRRSKMGKRSHWPEKAKIDKQVPIPKKKWSKISARDIAHEMQEGDSIFCKTKNQVQYLIKRIGQKDSVYRGLRRQEGAGFRVWKVRRGADPAPTIDELLEEKCDDR